MRPSEVLERHREEIRRIAWFVVADESPGLLANACRALAAMDT